jgi:hypothetical protein
LYLVQIGPDFCADPSPFIYLILAQRHTTFYHTATSLLEYTIAHVVATFASGNSQSLHTKRASFLDLPGEIRNQIYDLALKHDAAIRILGSPHLIYKQSDWCYDGNIPGGLALPLFQTCRTVYREAHSRFFQNNDFVIAGAVESHDPMAQFIGIIGVGWINALGGQPRSLRKIVFDIDTLCPLECYADAEGCTEYWSRFRRRDGLIEVQALLRAIWSQDLHFDIETVQPKEQPYLKVKAWGPSLVSDHPSNGNYACDPAAITKGLNSLVRDELGLRKYGRLLRGIGIKRNGSGGMVSWETLREASRRGCGNLDPIRERWFRCRDVWTNVRFSDSRILEDSFDARVQVQLNFALASPVGLGISTSGSCL